MTGTCGLLLLTAGTKALEPSCKKQSVITMSNDAVFSIAMAPAVVDASMTSKPASVNTLTKSCLISLASSTTRIRCGIIAFGYVHDYSHTKMRLM